MIRIIIDTREPSPHPWEPFIPAGVELVRETMETGDFALRAFPDGAIVERKTPADLAGCLTTGRERFERELRRSRHCGAFCVIVEGDYGDLFKASRNMNPAAVCGTVAAWSRRYCPFIFAGSAQHAAEFAFRYLLGQVRDHDKAVASMKREAVTRP
jgi:ERCC4-type nuclease